MGNKLTDEAREELQEAIRIVRADKFEAHAMGILGRFKQEDPPKDPKDPKDPPPDPKNPPPKDPKDPPEPKRVGLWPVGNSDDTDNA